MSTFAELDQLSSKELHDRAWRHAERHLNAKFFWNLLEMLPTALATAGERGEADTDVQRPSALIVDAIDEDPKLIDALRPVYIDYLTKHPDAV
jgi:hypothetical protein